MFPTDAARWLFTAKDGQHLPHAIEAAIEAHRVSLKETVSPIKHPALDRYHQLVEKDLNGTKGFKARRDAEQALAAYVRNTVIPKAALHEIQTLEKLAEGMASCRTSGQHGIGVNGAGAFVETRFQWHAKCRKSKLCPDESRLEGVRIAERYLPHIEAWLDSGKNRRAFYMVMTQPNAPVGTLHDAKRQMYTDFVNFIERLRHNKKLRKLVGDIQGAVVVQEDPLSARGDWNIHLNVVALVQGPFNWSECRKEWGGFQIHFEELKRDKLADAFRELCKYQAKATSVGNEHAKTQQPGMVDWSPECWLEWWRANHGFRRTRSYGVLYNLPELEDPVEEVADGGASDEVVRTIWMGRMTWSGGRYHVEHFAEALQYVGLIQADKSGNAGRGKQQQGPPPASNQGPDIPDFVYKGSGGSVDSDIWGAGEPCTGPDAPF